MTPDQSRTTPHPSAPKAPHQQLHDSTRQLIDDERARQNPEYRQGLVDQEPDNGIKPVTGQGRVNNHRGASGHTPTIGLGTVLGIGITQHAYSGQIPQHGKARVRTPSRSPALSVRYRADRQRSDR